MALKNQTEGISVATGGVRKDISRFAMPPEALFDGDNVINVDGTLVPRPQHISESWTGIKDDIQNVLYSIADLEDVFRRNTGSLRGINSSEDIGDIETDDATWYPSNRSPVRVGHLFFPSFTTDFFVVFNDPNWNPGQQGQILSLTQELGSPPLIASLHTMSFPDIFGVVVEYITSGSRLWAKVAGGWYSGKIDVSTNEEKVQMELVEDCDWVCPVGNFQTLIGKANTRVRIVDGDMNIVKEYDMGFAPSYSPIPKYRYVSTGSDHYMLLSVYEVFRVYKLSEVAGAGWGQPIATLRTVGNSPFIDADDTNHVLVSDGFTMWTSAPFGSSWSRKASYSGITTQDARVCGLADGNPIFWDGSDMIEFTPAIVDPLFVPLSMFQYKSAVEDKIIVSATPTSLRRLDTSTELWVDVGDIGDVREPDDPWEEIINPLSSAARPVFRTFDKGGFKYLVWTSIVGGLYSWKGDDYGTDTVEELSAGALCIMVLNDRLMRLNLGTGFENRIDISAHNDFQSGWGQIQIDILDDTPGLISGAREISALQGAVYKTDSIIHAIAQVEFGGVTSPVRYEITQPDISGPPCPHAVIGTGDGYHIFMGIDGGVYVYDGIRVHPVAKHAIGVVADQIDFARMNEMWGVLDKTRGLAFFFYPTGDGEITNGIIVDAQSGSVWPISLNSSIRGFSCGLEVDFRTDEKIGQQHIAFGQTGTKTIGGYDNIKRVVAIGFSDDSWGTQDWDSSVAYTDVGTPIEVRWSTGFMPLGTPPHIFKTVQEAYHTFSEVEQIGLNLRWTNRRMKEVQGPLRTITDDNRKTSHRNTGRLFAMDFAGSISKKFVYEGTSMSFRKRGQR